MSQSLPEAIFNVADRRYRFLEEGRDEYTFTWKFTTDPLKVSLGFAAIALADHAVIDTGVTESLPIVLSGAFGVMSAITGAVNFVDRQGREVAEGRQ